MRKILLLAICLANLPAFAAGAIDPKACLRGDPSYQLDCVQRLFSESEQTLNAVFSEAISSLEKKKEYGNEKNFVFENMSSNIRIAQRSWIYFREGQCELEATAMMGRQHVVATGIACRTRMNNERAAVVKAIVDDFLANTK